MGAAILDSVFAAGALDARDGAIAAMVLENVVGQLFSNVANLSTIRSALNDVSTAIVANAPAATKPSKSIRPSVIVRGGDERDLTFRADVSDMCCLPGSGLRQIRRAETAHFLP